MCSKKTSLKTVYIDDCYTSSRDIKIIQISSFKSFQRLMVVYIIRNIVPNERVRKYVFFVMVSMCSKETSLKTV